MTFLQIGILKLHMHTHATENNYQNNTTTNNYAKGKDSKSDYLRGKRLEMLDEIKAKDKFECLFNDNEILRGAEKMNKELNDWSMQSKCSICEESWFDKKFHADLGICDRCRKEKYKEKECYTFSKENDMIPGRVPGCLKELNDIEEASIKLIKPFLHIYKRKGGGVGYTGNCISFAQNVDTFVQSLPWSVKDLPIIVIQTINDTKQRKFCANATKIRKALLWLRAHHPDYKNIEINENALKEYPENGGDLVGITTIDDPNEVSAHTEQQSLNDDEFLQAVIDIEEQGDLPRPEAIVPETLQRTEISNMVKNAIQDRVDVSVAWPERGLLPESEYLPGWFRKAFPRHFPDGNGDITCARLGENVSLSQWVEHLLKVDHRFVNDVLFVMLATNIMLKRQALIPGNLYADRKLYNLSAKELKEIIKKIRPKSS